MAHAHAACAIFHPSLVTLFDATLVGDDRLLLAYEFVPSQALLEFSGGQPIPLKRATQIVVEVAEALAEVHAHECVHGGVSPRAVLMTLKGKSKLDRIGDPAFRSRPSDDVIAAADLLDQLIDRTAGRGITGMQGAQALIDRVRSGRVESAAAFAALLRRLHG